VNAKPGTNHSTDPTNPMVTVSGNPNPTYPTNPNNPTNPMGELTDK